MKEFGPESLDLDDMIARVPGVEAYADRGNAWEMLRGAAAQAIEKSPSARCGDAAVESYVSLELGQIDRVDDWIARFYPR